MLLQILTQASIKGIPLSVSKASLNQQGTDAGGRGAQVSDGNNNCTAFISKNINVPLSDTDPLTEANICKSEGKSGQKLPINTETAVV